MNRIEDDMENEINHTNQNQPVRISRRRLLIGLGGFAGVALVTVACGNAQQPQSGQDQAANAGQAGAPGGAGAAPNGTPGQGRFNMRETPAPELPTATPDATGLFVRRQDASLFIAAMGSRNGGNGQRPNGGTPGAQGTRRAPNGDATPGPYNGPTQEVVTNSDTKLYKDVTEYNFQAGQANNANNAGVQQKVEAVSSLDDLLGADATNGTLSIWGTKNGDQLVASVVLYRPRVTRQGTPTPSGQ
jgi:hypothetical protein